LPIVKLSQSFVTNSLTCPSDKPRVEWCCDEISGLYIEVRATTPGKGTYYLRYKDANNKTCHQKLGLSTDISLPDARKQARKLKAEIALGADPRGEEKARKAVLTFDEFFKDHYFPYVTPRKRSWDRDEQLFRLRIQPAFGKKRLNEVTRQQIQTFHTGLLDGGLSPASCDHHVKLIRYALNMAIEWDLLDKNPAAGVPLFNEDNKIERYLNDDELQRLLGVLRTDDNRMVCQIALFLLSTGARLNEALQAKWGQIDRGQRVWRISAEHSKSKRMRSVPLNDSALEVLDQLSTEGKHANVFVNFQTGKPYTTIMKVWTRLREKAGLPDLRIHDLRHQYASFLINSGRTLYEVQKILGHSDPSVTQRYAHLDSKSLQEAANSASVMLKTPVKLKIAA
jgi:integrase